MSLVITYQRFWQRRDTTANWESVNPILHSGEFGVEIIEDSSGATGELKLKLGNGTDAWNVLGYFVPSTTDDLPEGLTNLYYTADRAEQDIANLLDPGQGIALAYSPSNGSLTISVDAVAAEIPYDNSASGLTATEVQEAIDELAASPSGGGSWTLFPKLADETITSDDTLTSDADMQFSLAASTLYAIRGKVFFNTSSTPDFKFGLNYSGTTTSARTHWRAMAAGTPAGTDNENSFTTPVLVSSQAITSAGSGIGFVELDIIIVTDTSGTFAFQWAQNTSNAGATLVYGGSYLERSNPIV